LELWIGSKHCSANSSLIGIKLSDDAHLDTQNVAQHWVFVFYQTVKQKAHATHEKLSVFDSVKTVNVSDVT
jgi:hypothetical protein